MSPALYRHWAPVPFSLFPQLFFPGHYEGCSIKIPIRTGLRWLLLLADLYANANECRLLLRKIYFFSEIKAKQIKSVTEVWNVTIWTLGGKARPACTNLCTSHCFGDCCMPLVTFCQTTELLPPFFLSFSFFILPKYLLRWEEEVSEVRQNEMRIMKA